MSVHWKSSRAAFPSYQTGNVFTGSFQLRKDQTSNTGPADMADTVERLRLLTEMLEVRTGKYPHSLFKTIHQVIINWALKALTVLSPSIPAVVLCSDTRVRPVTASASYAKLFPVGSVVDGKNMSEIETFIISERKKNSGECGGLSNGESCSLLALWWFHIHQPDGNDGRGSDYSNTPSPHLQDLCPG